MTRGSCNREWAGYSAMALSLRVAHSSSLHTHIAHCVNMPYGLSQHSGILLRDMSTRRASGRDSVTFRTYCALRVSTRLGSHRRSLRQTRASRFGVISGRSRRSWESTLMALVRSRRLAEKIREEKCRATGNLRENRVKPSAYQFRFLGYKGVVVVDSQLDGIKMRLRGSQCTFPSTTKRTPTMRCTSPNNRR
jgi:hypothetical protein